MYARVRLVVLKRFEVALSKSARRSNICQLFSYSSNIHIHVVNIGIKLLGVDYVKLEYSDLQGDNFLLRWKLTDELILNYVCLAKMSKQGAVLSPKF